MIKIVLLIFIILIILALIFLVDNKCSKKCNTIEHLEPYRGFCKDTGTNVGGTGTCTRCNSNVTACPATDCWADVDGCPIYWTTPDETIHFFIDKGATNSNNNITGESLQKYLGLLSYKTDIQYFNDNSEWVNNVDAKLNFVRKYRFDGVTQNKCGLYKHENENDKVLECGTNSPTTTHSVTIRPTVSTSSAPTMPVTSSAPTMPVTSSAPTMPVTSGAPIMPVTSSAPTIPVTSSAPTIPVTSSAPIVPVPTTSTGNISSILTKEMWKDIFPNQANILCKTGDGPTVDILNYTNFIEACKYFPHFADGFNDDINKLEIAAFLANMTQETFGGWPEAPGGSLAWGGCIGSEGGTACYKGEYTQNGCTQYNDNDNDPACTNSNSKAGYYGRGPLQLTYCTNYSAAGNAINEKLLADPNILVRDGVAAFKASLWYWTTFNKGSCCDAIKYKTCHEVCQDPAVIENSSTFDFSKTIAIINGGVECTTDNNKVLEDCSRLEGDIKVPDGTAATPASACQLKQTEFLRRHSAFKRICSFMGISEPDCGSTCNEWAINGKCYSQYETDIATGAPGSASESTCITDADCSDNTNKTSCGKWRTNGACGCYYHGTAGLESCS